MLRKSTVIYIYVLALEVLIGICLSIDPDTARWLSTLLSGLFVGSIALFHQRIWNYFAQPKLDVVINLDSPDCHKTEIEETPALGVRRPCYYFRFRIYNHGESLAKDVEVIIEELWRKSIDTGQFVKDETFLPLNLVWSHFRSITQNVQPFGVFKFCDLGYIIDGRPLFYFDFFLEPFARPNFVIDGTYKVKVVASATNSRPNIRWFQIQWTGKWAEKKEEMFTQGHIVIEPTTPEIRKNGKSAWGC
jgi:hypothetical protein